ncbi:hypothetical protein PAHAL_7G074900 [Panicum hallii]|uniref:Uncharacterized protein n=1 Tax=Panicum hallii TaxID=206008 RepID=A0A2S3I5A1_9POAL|nr:hypothetical protein PAHAL_7G074900 [Panicum hallii]
MTPEVMYNCARPALHLRRLQPPLEASFNMRDGRAVAIPVHATHATSSFHFRATHPFHTRSYDAQQQRSPMGALVALMLVRSHPLFRH